MKHRQPPNHQSGYSLAEMLVVVAIIGVISLVSVPQFLSFQRANRLKSSMRQVMNDLRLARQQAITLRTSTRLRFASNSSQYVVEQRNADGTWSGLGRLANSASNRSLEKDCTISTPVDLQTVTISGTDYNAVVFLQDGTASMTGGAAVGSFTVRTSFALTRTSYTVQVHAPGFVKAI